MANVFAYNPNRVSVFAGGERITGFPKGTIITVGMSDKQFNYHAGLVDGVRTHNPNRHGTINITLLQGSPGNVIFESYLRQDITSDGIGYFPFAIFDNNGPGGALAWRCIGATCWVAKHPNWTISDGVTNKQWDLETNNINYQPLAPYNNMGEATGANRAGQTSTIG